MPTIHMHHALIENAQHQQASRLIAVVSILSLEQRPLHACGLCTSQFCLIACLLASCLIAKQDVGRANNHCTWWTVPVMKTKERQLWPFCILMAQISTLKMMKWVSARVHPSMESVANTWQPDNAWATATQCAFWIPLPHCAMSRLYWAGSSECHVALVAWL